MSFWGLLRSTDLEHNYICKSHSVPRLMFSLTIRRRYITQVRNLHCHLRNLPQSRRGTIGARKIHYNQLAPINELKLEKPVLWQLVILIRLDSHLQYLFILCVQLKQCRTLILPRILNQEGHSCTHTCSPPSLRQPGPEKGKPKSSQDMLECPNECYSEMKEKKTFSLEKGMLSIADFLF